MIPRRSPKRSKIGPRRLQDDLQDLFSSSFLFSILVPLGSDFCLILPPLEAPKCRGSAGTVGFFMTLKAHDGPRWPQDRPRRPQDPPRCPKSRPRAPQKTPQTPPKRSKIDPRPSQNDRKSIHPSSSSLIIFSLLLLSSCSSLFALLSSLFALLPFLFALRFSSLPLFVSSLLFSSLLFSSLLFLFSGGESHYWGLLGRSWSPLPSTPGLGGKLLLASVSHPNST